MVEWDQLVLGVCVSTRRQRARMLEVNMLAKELFKKKVSPTKGCRIKWEKEKLIHKDVIDELWRIQEVEDRLLEVCKDVPFDLKLAKTITQPRRLNKEELLWLIHQIDLMKDRKWSTKVAKEGDVHVELIGADMLMQRNVSLKELELFFKKWVDGC